jgi:hypothetical protein
MHEALSLIIALGDRASKRLELTAKLHFHYSIKERVFPEQVI